MLLRDNLRHNLKKEHICKKVSLIKNILRDRKTLGKLLLKLEKQQKNFKMKKMMKIIQRDNIRNNMKDVKEMKEMNLDIIVGSNWREKKE